MAEQTQWTEEAIKNSQECWESLITLRIDVALERVSRNPKYIKLCEQQDIGEKEVDTLLRKLDKKEQDIIHEHYDKEIERENYELEGTYMQGVKDGICFLLSLGVIQVKDWPD